MTAQKERNRRNGPQRKTSRPVDGQLTARSGGRWRAPVSQRVLGNFSGGASFGNLRNRRGAINVRPQFVARDASRTFDIKHPSHRHLAPLRHSLRGDFSDRLCQGARSTSGFFCFQTCVHHASSESISFYFVQASLSMKVYLS